MKKILFILLLFCFPLIATELTYTEDDSSDGNFRALGFPVPIPVASQTPVAGFREYQSLFARHQDIALSSAYVSGQVIGQTVRGEDIWAYVLSDNNGVTSEGRILEGSFLQNGGIHAREWQTPEVLTAILERFFDNDTDQGLYQYLLENSQIVLIPVLNIDGFMQTQRYPENAILSRLPEDGSDYPRDGRMRRKNMRGVDTDLATEDDYLLGVDLNRNSDVYWATSSNSSDNNTSIVHHGSGPASENEIQALQAAADIADGRLRFYIDTHSFTKIYLTPMTGHDRRDSITTSLAERMRSVNNFSYRFNASNPGGGIGATDEYFANTYEIPSYTLETEPGQSGAAEYGGFGVSHDGFILPDSEIERVRNELTNASVLGYYIQAGAPSLIQVEISKVSDNSTIYKGRWQTNTAKSRVWTTLENIALETDVNYRFRVVFNKVMRWRNQGQVAQFSGQSVRVKPTIKIEGYSANGDAFNESLNTENGSWIDNIGNENNGYAVYKDDSFVFEFSLAAGTSVIGATLQQLSISTTDMAGQQLDSNPATVIDWESGAWSNYESSNGTLADSGGVDRTIRLIDDGSPAFVAPSNTVVDNEVSNNSSSGGGVFSLLLLLNIGMFLRYRVSSNPVMIGNELFI